LETLLASPISDRAILWGKMAAQYTVVGAHVVLVSLAAGITSAILLGVPGLLVLAAGLVLGSLTAAVTSSFMVGLGILLSLRAPTVKKAQERLGYVMIPIFMLPSFAPALFGLAGPPNLLASLAMGLLLPIVFVGGAITFNVLAFARFRRDRLIGII
jgi:ABC-2 type transport system permease protein